jgi:Holliday junction resolvase-like predicted endonuclease
MLSPLRILDTRVATPHGEVDLVAITGNRLVCVEVKTGRTKRDLNFFGAAGQLDTPDHWRPGHRVDQDDLDRLGQAAAWLAKRLSTKDLELKGRVDLCELLIATRAPATLGLFHHPGIAEPLARPSSHVGPEYRMCDEPNGYDFPLDGSGP